MVARSHRARTLAAVMAAALTAALCTAASASANMISSFTVSGSTMQAGAHPNVTATIDFNGDTPKDMTVSLPAGLVGNPQAVSQSSWCTSSLLSSNSCPAVAQIGTTQVNATALGLLTETYSGTVFLYQPAGSEPVDLGIYVTTGISDPIIMTAPIELRPDGGLNTVLSNIPETATNVSLLFGASVGITINWMSLTLDGTLSNGNAFMTNPTNCSSESASITATGWSGNSGSASTSYQATGCGSLSFTPTISTTLGTAARDTPTSVTVSLNQPNPGNGTAQAALQNVNITLPPGLVLSTGLASGTLAACTDAQLSVSSGSPSTCPAASQIGTASFATPLLSTIDGTVYLGTQTTQNQYRIFIQLAAPGTDVKLIALVIPDTTTGQITTTLTNLPQIPLTNFTLNFQGGSQAVFDAPTTCGTLSGSATLTPWSGGSSVGATPSVTVSDNGSGGACPSPLPFAPTLGAALTNGQAGAATDLTLTVTRADRSDRLASATITLPPGLGASILNVPTCASTNLNADNCPLDTQLGTVSAVVGSGSGTITLSGGIFLAAPTGAAPDDLAIVLPAVVGPFNLGNVVALAPITVDPITGAIGQTATLPLIVQGIPIGLRQLTLTLNAPDYPNFLTNATTCAAAQFSATFNSVTGQSATATAPYQPTGCDTVPFTPTVTTTLGSSARDVPSAVAVTLGSPGTGQSTLKNVSLTMPPGLVLSAGIASGTLAVCTDAQLGAGSGSAATCPAASQVGTATFTSTLIPAIDGTVYLGTPTASNPFRVFVVLPVAGVDVKLVGLVTLDPATGQVTTVFSGLPQIPFTSFQLSFQGGAQAVFNTPTTCGTFTGEGDLTPWSGNGDAVVQTGVTISEDGQGAACASPLPFHPSLATSVSTTQAGASPALTVTIARDDRDARPTSLALTLPPGLGASLSSTPMCALASAQAGSCSSSSLLGQVSAVVGSGSGTLTLDGDVYLAQGSGSAPAALAIMLPAVVGPFNLGTSVTLANISVGASGSISQTASLPTIIGGIPVSLRQLTLTLNRPGFMTNATGCGAEQFSAVIGSADGQSVALSSPYQATGCGTLPFAPGLNATIVKDDKDDGGSLQTVVTLPAGDANLASAVIALPASLAVRISAIAIACSATQAAAGACPASSAVGSVTAQSPLLPGALSGPVDLERTADGGFALGIDLGGAISLPLTAAVDIASMTTTLGGIPDLPVSRFELDLSGGAASMLTPVSDACYKPGTLSATFTSHSGATATAKLTPLIKPCPAGSPGALGGAADSNAGGGSSSGPSLKVRLSSSRVLSATLHDPGIRYVRFAMPRGIALAAHRPGLRVTVNGRTLGSRAIKLTPHSLLLKLGSGVNTIVVTVRPPALVLSGALAHKLGHRRAKLTFKARTRTSAHSHAGLLTASA